MSYHQHRTYNTHNIDITLQQPSAVEAARLLKEVEREAERRFVDGVRITDNKFNCVVHLAIDHQCMQELVRVTYSLNDEKNSIVCSVSPIDSLEDNINHVRDVLAVEIANTVLQNGFTKQMYELLYNRYNAKPPVAPKPITISK